tara:strand:+ start:1811 stop:2074 length:264 start_codon:yes stop_codon:yes gene_type:complete
MSSDIEKIKKRIIFRSSHRGSKEMDMLISSFAASIIDKLNFSQLKSLDKFVNYDDEELIKIKDDLKISVNSIDNEIYKLFYNYKIKF